MLLTAITNKKIILKLNSWLGGGNAGIPRISMESFQQMINDLISEVNTLGGP